MNVVLANPAARESVDAVRERYYIKAGSRWPWSYVKKKGTPNTCCFFPFFQAYSAALLQQDGFNVHVIDGVALDLSAEEFIRRLGPIDPDLLVVETATHAIHHDMALLTEIKRQLPGVTIMATGLHATVFPEELLATCPAVSFVAMGEYEYTVREVARRLAAHVRDFSMDGLAHNRDGYTWVSPCKGRIPDVNTLPRPAFELFPSNDTPDLARYHDGINTDWPAVTLHASRGCPYRCDFCAWNQVMYDSGSYRPFDPARVVDEMAYVQKQFGAREIYFDDDDFCVSRKHVMALCREMSARNLGLPWACMGDAMNVDEEMFRAMAAAGCIFMKFGVESGSRRVLRNIGKPLKPERAVDVARWGRKYRVMTHATFSLGLDGETPASMRATLALANRIPFDTAQVSIATPFPGTRYFEKLRRRGQLDDTNWGAFDGTRSCVLQNGCLPAADIEAFRKKAIMSMILHKVADPVWLVRFIRRNLSLFGRRGPGPVLAPFKALLQL
ncbi:MAG: radical SAM protein [Desulfobacterales bacterium]|nr:radical SAM protein [Desulfobacterales bacterium]